MSRTCVCLASIAALFALCGGAASAAWLSDNFDSYATGNLAGKGGWAGDAGPMRVQSTFVQSGKAVKGDYLAWGNGDVYRYIDSGLGTHTIEFDAAIDTACNGYGSNVGYLRVFEAGGLELTRFYFAHQQFKVLTSGGAQPAILDNTGNRVWHHILLRINMMTSRMDVSVNGVQKLTQVGLYKSGNSIGRILIGSYDRQDEFTKSEMYMDNLVCDVAPTPPASGLAGWTSPNRYRVLLTADSRGVARDNSPASFDVDLPATFASMGGSGTFDENTIEVIGYDSVGAPVEFDTSRQGYEKYLLPWRLQKYYPLTRTTLSFVMPTHESVQYAVYFDNVESRLGKPDRYPGLVGDGDCFVQGYGRREIGPSKMGDMCDIDGDGDLDLFEGGVEPFIYCYENVGGNRMVDRGRLTSAGSLFELAGNAGSHRAWMTVTFHDWDGDGDQDLFPSFTDGPDGGDIVFYRNITVPGGALTFSRVGEMYTQSGASVGGGGWFPTPTFVVDWDGTGDGLTDILVARSEWDGGHLYLHRSLGPGGSSGYVLADGVRIQAGGQDINLTTPRFDCADIDGDGDLDLVSASHDWGRTYINWYKNIGTRQNPVFAAAVELAAMGMAYPGLEIADFDNDGLLDIAVGTFWKQVENADPQCFGGLLKNIGPQANPTFELRLAVNGSPYTEQFQPCDAGQQNGVRSLDWDNDGDNDLVASSSGGLLVYFRNLTNDLFPVFGPRQTLMVGGANPYPVEVGGIESGYARHDMADWDGDGLIDLVVGDEDARVFVFLSDGLGNDPPTFEPGYQLWAAGQPINGLMRGSTLVCDWNNDGKKDLIFGMAPKQDDYETTYNWPDQGDSNKTNDEGFLFYKNVGTNPAPPQPGSSSDSTRFAYPSWVRAGGQIVTYTRPNLGSFVDWDGDGVKDFIGCDFENNVRFYKNTGSGAPNTEPVLSPAAGTILVEPYVTTQMISGADVLDFNGDGDLDVLTGMGHGGSSLRFYERDYVDDYVRNQTYPIVSVGGSEQAFTTTQVKSLPNGASVTVIRGTVTACFDGFFYIQSDDRLNAIRIEMPSYAVVEGTVVDVRGTLGTTAAGERYVAAAAVVAT